MADIPDNVPSETPVALKKIFAIVFTVSAIFGAAAYAIDKIKPVGNGIYDFCRYTYVCAPAPLNYLQPLASGYAKGNTVARASASQFSQYTKDNPDWNICLRNTRSISKSGPFNSNVEYRMEGEFYAVPKWRGLFEKIADLFAGRNYMPEACHKG